MSAKKLKILFISIIETILLSMRPTPRKHRLMDRIVQFRDKNGPDERN